MYKQRNQDKQQNISSVSKEKIKQHKQKNQNKQ